MTKRLTPELEQEIRDYLARPCLGVHSPEERLQLELISEIDRLRSEVGALRTELNPPMTATRALAIEQADKATQYWTDILKERDKLDDDLASAHLLIDQLKAENEKLKTNQLFEASCTHLFEENQKLRARVAKLREALKTIRGPAEKRTLDGLVALRLLEVASEALTQDDEMEKK